ncbi:nucleotidyltransferase domain-containing protein, partial [candidate division WOR-3 bacterium]|nr:nucleotidyltransferase domain-containing protein [candidate division WOR-3 bacterium]
MKQKNVERNGLVATVVKALKPLDYIHAVWEGGAASFDRVDEWSDVDLYVVCDDEGVEDTFAVMKQAIGSMSDMDLEFRLPEPTWHGHSQVFWRLADASPFLFMDIAVMKKSSKDKFLQYRIHGKPFIHFDKIGVVKDDPVEPEGYFQQIKARLEMLKTNVRLFQVLVLKELNRGNDIEALSYYVSYIFRPLVEVLRMKHSPWHYRFFTTYVYYEMP